MSRILRRPMFRGGRVDSRGTGITSGLSYKKGGRVGYKDAGAVTGGQINQEALDKIMGKKGRFLGDLNRGLTSVNDLLYNYIARPLGNLPYMASDYVLGTEFGEPIKKKNSFEEYLEAFGGADKILGKNRGREFVGDELEIVGDPRQPLPDVEPKKIPKKEKSLEELMKEMMGEKKSPKEKVKEYKEMFREAYGTGRADDASAMALSFAKNALKDDATVKSAFAGFFDDESKRPSERKKYDDAATTAAIQAYLTGEKDYDSLMKQMKIIDYQIDKKAQAAKANETLDVLLETYAGNSGDRTDAGVMQAAFNQFFRDTEGYAGFKGKLPENKEDLIVGAVYFADDPNDTRTKIIYQVDASGTPQEISRILK
jgi:hypothetical protein